MEINYQLITYRLNQDGTIPDFLYKGNDGIGGQFPIYDLNTLPPQDIILFGLSEYHVTLETPNIVSIISTKEELTTYLTQIFNNTNDSIEEENSTLYELIESIWNIYTTKNAL
jgi:hypothetical protein